MQLFGGLVDRVPTGQPVGAELSAMPHLGVQLVAAGHELAHHSWSPDRMIGMSRSRIADEIERTDRELARAGQPGPFLFRPPHGKKLFGLPRYRSFPS